MKTEMTCRTPALVALLVTVGASGACSGSQRRSEPEPELASGRRTLPSPTDDERPPPAQRRAVPVLTERNEASPRVTFRVVFETGSASDPSGHEGAAYVTARTMVQGGTESLTYEELTRRLFPMAARLDFHVDRDMTVFTGQVPRDHLAEFYPLLRDVILRPRMAEDDFRRIRSQTRSTLTQELRGNNDEELGKEYLQSLIYANHPYGHPAYGTERGLAALDLDGVRTFRTGHFCKDRVIVGLSGAYPEAFVAEVQHDFDQLPTGCAPRSELPDVQRPRGMHVVVVDKPTASSTAISFGHPVSYTRRDTDFAPVQFATNYLGLHRQSSGVLYTTIREARGLNYGDYAYAEHFEQSGYGRFPEPNIQRRQQYASIWLRPLRPVTAHFALRAAVRALGETVAQGVPAREFDRTRTFLTGYVNLFAQDESTRLGHTIDAFWNGFEDRPYIARMQAAWGALDAATVAAAARRHLSAQDLWVAIVAPNARELADAIARNAPSPISYDSPKPQAIMDEDREIATFALPVRPEDVRVVPLEEVFR